MERLHNLYRQIIMDHYKKPRHQGLIDDPSYTNVHLKNPSCGDDITIAVKREGSTIVDVRHQGSGCSICCSSASIMADLMIGKTTSEAQTITAMYASMLQGETFDESLLKEAAAYQGIKQFPARYKCATLAWQAFEAALKEEGESYVR